jgi:hypothetical protein
MTLAATYRGTLGIDMFRSRDVNAPLPPSYTTFPNPALGVVRQIESRGRQVGNALDLTLQGKRRALVLRHGTVHLQPHE